MAAFSKPLGFLMTAGGVYLLTRDMYISGRCSFFFLRIPAQMPVLLIVLGVIGLIFGGDIRGLGWVGIVGGVILAIMGGCINFTIGVPILIASLCLIMGGIKLMT